jgi:hypothetical protein
MNQAKKKFGEWFEKWFIFVIIVMLIGVFMFIGWSNTLNNVSFEKLPQNLQYRSIEESGGIFGGTDYYVFDSNGKRYQVSQSTFDKLYNLPRE